MVQTLQDIAEDEYHLEFVFFANTFPIAFHYSEALKRVHPEINPGDYIRIGNWNQNSIEENKKVIRYTNRTGSDRSPITTFNPKLAFVPLTLSSSMIYQLLVSERSETDRNNEGPVDLIEFVEAAKRQGYEKLWIYSELEDMGNYIEDLTQGSFLEVRKFQASGQELGNQAEETDRTLRPNVSLPFFEETGNTLNLLRIFIYGGSLSSYLSRKKAKYIALELPENPPEGTTDWMRTYIFSQNHQDALKEYHKKLYESACNPIPDRDKCPPFFNVYRKYNDMSWLLQHRSSFKDANEYCECIREHHTEDKLCEPENR